MKIERFEDIQVWQESRILANMIFDVTKSEKMSKRYRFISQIEAAAVSVMNNIAEGFSRKSDKEFIQFLFISKGSVAEVQSMLYLSLDRLFIDKRQFEQIYVQADKTARMISKFVQYLRKGS